MRIVARRLFLKGNKIALVSHDDYETLSTSTWHADVHGYVLARRGRPNLDRLHRVVMNARPGQFVDHINGNKLDNRRENLRFCTPGQNVANRGRAKGRAFKGVTLASSGRWRARIIQNRVEHLLGHFDTQEEAARAYDRAAVEMFGEFARTNFARSAS